MDDANSQAQPFLAVIAAEQTAGRGRRSRAWLSPPGTSIAMSLVLPVPDPAQGAAWGPLVIGLAVRDALADLLTDDAQAEASAFDEAGPAPQSSGATGDTRDAARARFALKWPNDVLVEGAHRTSAPAGRADGPAKVSGILCQLIPQSGLMVAGIGVNVTVPLELLPVPQGTAPAATSLHLVLPDHVRQSQPISREDVAEAIGAHVATRHRQWINGGADFVALKQDYRAHCRTIDTLVDIHLPGDLVRRARVTGVDECGELAIIDDSGLSSSVIAGDVVHIRSREQA